MTVRLFSQMCLTISRLLENYGTAMPIEINAGVVLTIGYRDHQSGGHGFDSHSPRSSFWKTRRPWRISVFIE